MKLKTVSILLAACYVKINSCENSLEEYLGPDSKSGDLSEESQTGGKVLGYTTSSVYEFFRSLGFVAYTDTIPGYFITFPGNKEQNAYFNSTSNVFPLVYTLTGAALVAYVSGYLLTQIPIIDGLRRSTDDEDLGFGRTYDEFDEADSGFDYDVSAEYDYNYPDSFYSAASEPEGTFLRKDKKRRKMKSKMKRRSGIRFDEVLERKQKESSIFDTITSAVRALFNPTARNSDTLLGGGFEAFVKRYDGYWRRRRSDAGKPNWEFKSMRKQARADTRQEVSASPGGRFVGPQLPRTNKEAGSGFYKDRVDEVYDNYFDNRST